MSASNGGRDPLSIIAFAESNWQPIGGAIAGGIMGLFTGFFSGLIDVVTSIFGLLVQPIDVLGLEVGNFLGALVGGAADIVTQGAVTTQQAIAPGQPWAVGPLTFAFGIVSAAAGWYVFARVLAADATSDLLPFTGTDVPGVGANEEQEGND
jgi:hypothetical protein